MLLRSKASIPLLCGECSQVCFVIWSGTSTHTRIFSLFGPYVLQLRSCCIIYIKGKKFFLLLESLNLFLFVVIIVFKTLLPGSQNIIRVHFIILCRPDTVDDSYEKRIGNIIVSAHSIWSAVYISYRILITVRIFLKLSQLVHFSQPLKPFIVWKLQKI